MNFAAQLVDALLEGDPFPDSQMLGTRRERRVLDQIKARRGDERSRQGATRADSENEWSHIGHEFKHALQTAPGVVRQRLALDATPAAPSRNVGEALGVYEGEGMPDWLKKKLGKSDDGEKEGCGKEEEEGGKDGAGGEKAKKKSSTASDVAGGPKEKGVGKAKDGEGKVEHTF